MTFTRDSLFHGKLTVLQPEEGYRFSVDSVLLGAFASGIGAARCVDLGSGCGVVGFILLHAGNVREVVGVEIDPVLARASREGAVANGFQDRHATIEADLRDPSWRDRTGEVDLVVSNPPYFEMSSGRESPDASRARARHDGSCTLDDVLDAARACLGPKGRLCVILPPGRMGSLIASASSRRLLATRLRPVYPKPGRASRQVLIELRLDASPGALVLEPPLLVHDLGGEYTPEAQDFLSGSFR